MGAAVTGSGKTLAFLEPVVELLYNLKFSPRNDTGAIIICPTGELAIQMVCPLFVHTWCCNGLDEAPLSNSRVGYWRCSSERGSGTLSEGVNILVATHGRLLDYLQHTKGFIHRNLKIICISMDQSNEASSSNPSRQPPSSDPSKMPQLMTSKGAYCLKCFRETSCTGARYKGPALSNHNEIMHPDDFYLCPTCMNAFNTEGELKDHVRKFHG